MIPDERKERLVRHAKFLGTIWVALFVVDIATGAPMWSHWPGIPLAALLGLEAVPLFVHDRLTMLTVCGAVIVGALALINLFSWAGYPWVMWPAGALVVLEIIRRSRVRR